MLEFTLDLTKNAGKIKPMNAVNNGPETKGVRDTYTNFDSYTAARIPYARNHDASFYSGYGGEHTVDVHRIFRDFNADENDPESYIFEPTDKYTASIIETGTKVFYRLGASIEHEYKFGTRVPADFAKWARICEHIIRHYTEGWADGFNYDIEYWEIWNEADCHNADGSNPCWQGTNEEFIDFYATVATHLKACFPDKKIGGPAFASVWSSPFVNDFLDRVVRDDIPLDFFSYHWYGKEFLPFKQTIDLARKKLDDRGLYKTETILNEWNYIKGWAADKWKESLATEKNYKGSSFITAAMCIGQNGPLNMLMYYDARPCGMNGLFAHEFFTPLKGYYSIYAFSDLAELGTAVPITSSSTAEEDHGVYATAAKNDAGKTAILMTYYKDETDVDEQEVTLNICGSSSPLTFSAYVLDKDNDLKKIWTTTVGDKLTFTLPLYTTLLLKSE